MGSEMCIRDSSCTVLFVSISQVIGYEDRLRNDLYCVEWGVEPYSIQHTTQLMPLPLTVSCFSRIEIGFTFLVPACPGRPGQRAVKRRTPTGVDAVVCLFVFLVWISIELQPGVFAFAP